MERLTDIINGWTFEETIKTAESLMEAEKNMFKWDVLRHLRDFAEKYLRQGTKIIVEGRWQTGNYTNKDGQKVYTNDCVVERHEFCESKNSNSNSDNGSSSRPAPTDDDGFMNIPDGIDDGLPFN